GKFLKYVLLSRPHVAINYVEDVHRHATAPIIYYGHDLHWLRLAKEYEVTGDDTVAAEMEQMRALEERVWENADIVLYPIAEECGVVRQRFPEKHVSEIPGYIYGHAAIAEARRRADGVGRRDALQLLFVGGFVHRPNCDGILWFIQEVFPRLH